MARTKSEELKYTKEIVIYMVQRGNEPLSPREIADGLELNYTQVRNAIRRGQENNRFKRVWIPPKDKKQINATYYVSTLRTFEEIENVYGIKLERSSNEEGNSVIFVRSKGEGGGIVSVAPLSRNIHVEGRPVTDWMEYMANRAVATQGLMQFINTWPQMLGEMADIGLKGHKAIDPPLRTQLRIDELYNELLRRIKVFERFLNILKEVKENPLLWSASFYRETLFTLKDLQVAEEDLAKYSKAIETNYGKLVFRERSSSE